MSSSNTEAMVAHDCPSLSGPYTKTEQKVWQEICHQKDINLLGQPAVSAQFINTILTNPHYTRHIPQRGILIRKAQITGTLNLEYATIPFPVRIEETTFDSPPQLSYMKTSSLFSLKEAEIPFNDKNVDKDLSLRNAIIGKHLDFQGAHINSKLDMGHIQIQGSLFLSRMPNKPNSRFKSIVISNAEVKEKVSLEGTDIDEFLDMVRTKVGSNVILGGKSKIEHLKLRQSQIEGDLEINDSNITNIDLTEAHVDRTFKISLERLGNDSSILLRHAAVGMMDHSTNPDNWPKSVELTGFIYTRLGGFLTTDHQGREIVDLERLKGWLRKQRVFSRQAYEQMAKILEFEGYSEDALEIHFEGRERERARHPYGFTWVWMTLLKWSIGYGYRNWYSIIVATSFILIGALIFRATPESRMERMPYGLTYSFDLFLPLIKLREHHYRIDIKGWQRYYFYFHKLVGALLASFILAGLSGLTQ